MGKHQLIPKLNTIKLMNEVQAILNITPLCIDDINYVKDKMMAALKTDTINY